MNTEKTQKELNYITDPVELAQARKGFEKAYVNMIGMQSPYSKDYMFYGHLVARCKILFSYDLPAPCGVRFNLDQYELCVNPQQFDPEPLERQLAILKHEMMHNLLGHVLEVLKDKSRGSIKVNIAQDCSINQMIDQSHIDVNQWILPSNLPFLKDGLTLPVAPDLNYEQYEAMIDPKKCPENKPQQGQGQEQSQQGNGKGTPNHDFQNSSEGDADMSKDITKNMLEQSTNATQKGRGNLPSNLDKMMELFSRKAQITWQKVLRNIVGNKRTNSRRTIMRSDRRFPTRDDLRGKTKDRTFGLLVVGDESGSMSDTALTQCISEIVHICNVTKTDLDYVPVDTEAHAPMKLSKSQRSFKRSACGGTNLHPALDKAKEHGIDYQAIVVITDGGLSESDVQKFKDTGKKVIWVVESTGHIMNSMNSGNMQAFKLSPV